MGFWATAEQLSVFNRTWLKHWSSLPPPSCGVESLCFVYVSTLYRPVSEQTKESQEDEKRREDEFWHTPCAFTPESRVEAHRHLEEKRKAKEQWVMWWFVHMSSNQTGREKKKLNMLTEYYFFKVKFIGVNFQSKSSTHVSVYLIQRNVENKASCLRPCRPVKFIHKIGQNQ